MGQAPIPVIDLFAGPGGLGEGFAGLRDQAGARRFRIALSIEKDRIAHTTLELRAFFRQFQDSVPDEYYAYVRDRVNGGAEAKRLQLFDDFPAEARQARTEAWNAVLGGVHPDVINDRIRQALNGSENWILIGGPPCQAYSLVGRSRMRHVLREKFEADSRHLLYQEYLRIIADHAPPVFVMENVKGLLSATLSGASTFSRILHDLSGPGEAVGSPRSKRGLGYDVVPLTPRRQPKLWDGTWRPTDYIVRSEDYGVPQARHRLILVGLRMDVAAAVRSALQLPKADARTSIAQVADSLPTLRAGLAGSDDSDAAWLRLLASAPDQDWLRAAGPERTTTARLREEVLQQAREVCEAVAVPSTGRGSEFVECDAKPRALSAFLTDSRLGGVPNHASRSHISGDLQRYLFAATFAAVTGDSPRLWDFPRSLLPDHKNAELAAGGTGPFADRFRVQLRDRPATTVTSHISRDGHYYIHYDPGQARTLTVREAARLQTFPDNYVFEGPRTSQYVQVGNAVPPLLARQIAATVAGLLD